MQSYLECSKIIDMDHPAVVAKAAELARNCSNEVEITRRCFTFVRDSIRHSGDFRMNPTTCAASEVLLRGQGYCFAKSHLLAALLRANHVPAGLCYQRLKVDPGGVRYCLHGLNAVWLKDFGWYRIDPRGNKPGVTAAFRPPVEQLAFPVAEPGEADLPEIWPEPLPAVVAVLQRCETFDQVFQNLPDVELLPRFAVVHKK